MYILAGAVLLFGLVPFLAVRLYATRVARANESVPDRLHRLERLQQVTSFSLPILSILAVFQFGLIERITAGLESIAPGISTLPGADSVLSVAVIFAMATLPIIGVVLGLYPTTRSLRDTSASPFRVVRNTVAGIAMTAVVIGLAVGGILAITSVVGSSLPVLIGGVCLVIFAVFGLTPYLIVLFQDRVPLEGARRDRIERLCGDLGYEPRGLYLLEGESTKTANAMVAGTVPGLRYVFLTDYLLEECSDDELRAILAHEFGHVAGRHLWQRGLLTVGVIVAAVVAAEPLGITALEAQFGFAGFFVPVMAGYIVYTCSCWVDSPTGRSIVRTPTRLGTPVPTPPPTHSRCSRRRTTARARPDCSTVWRRITRRLRLESKPSSGVRTISRPIPGQQPAGETDSQRLDPIAILTFGSLIHSLWTEFSSVLSRIVPPRRSFRTCSRLPTIRATRIT